MNAERTHVFLYIIIFLGQKKWLHFDNKLGYIVEGCKYEEVSC